ncbi:MAG TPA: hypothetical protein PLU49_12280 [Saprospiraceae bacterium]|nr:hypothetical protein [Saprospiraceae bacterium]
MKRIVTLISPLVFVILFLPSCKESSFVTTRGNQFYVHEEPYIFMGTNYWYGGYLWQDSLNNGRERLQKELDFLVSKGITNLRVMIAGEGDGSYPFRIHPAVQENPGIFDESILKSFDFFVAEAGKRNLRLIMVLNNNWEWSGGFGKYLEWAAKGTAPWSKTESWDWDAYRTYISQFYSCKPCLEANEKWIKTIISRKNTFNHKYYFDDPAIMTWELANEPRPMMPEAVEAYIEWVKKSAILIKSLAKNQLVTIGVEGYYGTEQDMGLFENIHKIDEIDYATIHIWPKTWQWYDGKSENSVTQVTLKKTIDYMDAHSKVMKKINKPLVLEEFGLHRDGNDFSPEATVDNRDVYYTTVFKTGMVNGIAGYNFWGAFTLENKTTPDHFWKHGMPYSADPPQEEQGLYGVYMEDSTTWKIISDFAKKIQGTEF